MVRPNRRLRRLAVAISCAFLCAPAASQAAEVLPDLIADPPVDRGLQVVDGRLLLRFDGYIRNTGAGAAELFGTPGPGGTVTGVKQRVYNDDTSVSREVDSPAVIRYENHVSHSHFHLQSAARYSLWTESASFEVIASEKAGFCLTDSRHIELTKGPPLAEYDGSGCWTNDPDPPGEVRMGTSSGWRDDYPASLAFQWLDVSNLAPGSYRLGADVDPDNFVIESNEANAVAFQDQVSIVPGYVARAQELGEVDPFRPVEIVLGADAHTRTGTTLGAPAYAIATPPACGSLTGEPPNVTYVPGSACRGSVAFDFSARDSTTSFPTTAPTATVSLRLGPRDALSRPRVRRRGRRLRVRMRSLYAGRVRATALRKGRRLGSCSARAQANRTVACTIKMRRRHRLRRIRLRTSLRIGGRVVDKRRDRAS